MTRKTRAHSAEDKHQKYLMILDTTQRLFAKERVLQTTARIADEAGIAKGTVYLYFKTKEEIYMCLLVEQFGRWHRKLRDYLLDHHPSIDAFIAYICQSLSDFTVFLDLISRSAMILEENLSLKVLRESRLAMRQESLRSAQLVSRHFQNDQLNEKECLKRLRRFYTYSIAYWKECFPSHLVVKALPEDFSSSKSQMERYFNEIHFMARLIWNV